MRKALSILICLCQSSWAVVTFNNTNTATQGTSSPLTISYSVTAGCSNIVAFAEIVFDGSSGMSAGAVTYGGQTMTSAGSVDNNTNCNAYAQVFYLPNPPTGSNTLSVTINGSIVDIYADLVSFCGVDQTNPIRSGTYQNPSNPVANGSGSYSLTVTSNANDLSLTDVTSCASVSGFTATNQTLDASNGLGSHDMHGDHATTAAASVTHTWSGADANSNLAIVGFSICNSGGNCTGAAVTGGSSKKDKLRKFL